MPRPRSASYNDAREVIEQHLTRNGTPPTIAEMVRALGGSATTNAAYKRRWLDENRPDIDKVAALGAWPDPLSRGVLRAVDVIWTELAESLHAEEKRLYDELADKARAADEAVAEAHSTAQGAARRAEELAQELADADTREQAGAEREKALSEELQAIRGELAQQRTHTAALTTKLAERDSALGDAKARLELVEQRAQAAFAAHQDELSALRTAHALELEEVRRRLDAAHRDAAEQRQAVSNLREDLAGERAQAAASEKARQAAEDRATRERDENRKLSAQLADTREAARHSEAEAARTAQQCSAALESASAVATEKEARIAELTRSLEELRAKRRTAVRKPRGKSSN